MFGWLRTNKSLREELAREWALNAQLRTSLEFSERERRVLKAKLQDRVTPDLRTPPCSAHALEPDRHATRWPQASRGMAAATVLSAEPRTRASAPETGGGGRSSGDFVVGSIAGALTGAAVAAMLTPSSAAAEPAPAPEAFAAGGGDYGGGGATGNFE